MGMCNARLSVLPFLLRSFVPCRNYLGVAAHLPHAITEGVSKARRAAPHPSSCPHPRKAPHCSVRSPPRTTDQHPPLAPEIASQPQVIEDDLVRARQGDKQVGQEQFHLWLTMARLVAQSLGESELTCAEHAHRPKAPTSAAALLPAF